MDGLAIAASVMVMVVVAVSALTELLAVTMAA